MKKDRIVLICGAGSAIGQRLIAERFEVKTVIVNDAERYSSVFKPKAIPIVNTYDIPTIYQEPITRKQRRANKRKNK